jgi:hypothetical protein
MYTFEEDKDARTLTVAFDPPITVENMPNKHWDTMVLKQPKLKHLKMANAAMNKGDIDVGAKLIACVSGWPDKAVDEIELEVFTRAQDFLLGFARPGPGTST